MNKRQGSKHIEGKNVNVNVVWNWVWTWMFLYSSIPWQQLLSGLAYNKHTRKAVKHFNEPIDGVY